MSELNDVLAPDAELVHTETEETTHGTITYRLFIEPEQTPVRGNALCSGDDADDKALEDSILERLERGETWAWADVTVEAALEDGRTGIDTLGCCSYRDTEEFIEPDGYWPDLKREALRMALAKASQQDAGGASLTENS